MEEVTRYGWDFCFVSSFGYSGLWSRCGNVYCGCATHYDVVSSDRTACGWEYANDRGEGCGCPHSWNVGGRGRRSAKAKASGTALWVC